MLDLFICHLNPSAMRRLAEKLEEISLDSEIRRHLERILRVRSTTWSQGGIFANFAAESMVPKGPEWAGGNWEIKTPATTKAIPAWEISAEVMPYMRTGEGSIPTIVADHIGIYLGMIRGRGNVVEVSEKSLVMPSNMGPSGENKPVMNPLKPDDSAGGSLARQLGLSSGAAPAAEDQQAKAAEEFRRSMQGVTDDGASSDEEDSTSRTKKIQIRIRDKPVAGPADVNKLKEATKSLGLVAPPGPPARTRSLTVPPPAGPPLPQAQDQVQWPPAQPTPPAATNSGVDLFGTNAFTAGPQTGTGTGPVVAGTSVTARPIPEDFFRNTISSLQVAASAAATLPPEGKILSQVAQGGVPMQGGQARPVAPQAALNQNMMNVGLPEGGVPPQAHQVPPQVTF